MMIGGSMNGKMIPLLVIAVGWIQTTCHYTAVNSLPASLIVTNDAPTILGANTTFTATLNLHQTEEKSLAAKTKSTKYLYSYSWTQTICGEKKVIVKEQNLICNFSQVYNCQEDIGLHSVTVTVKIKEFIFFDRIIAENSSDFMITEFINAKLNITQGASCNSTHSQNTCDVVATNKSVHMSIDIHDPSDFFKDAMLLYYWVFGDGTTQTTIDEPQRFHNYSKPGHYRITVNITAVFPDGNKHVSERQTRTGTINHNLQTMDAIKNLTIRGSSNVDVGTKARFKISCHASLPVVFCWYVIHTTHMSALSLSHGIPCNRTVLTNKSWLEVDHWFNHSGNYNVGVYAQNAVSSSNSIKNVSSISTVLQRVTGLVVGILVGITGCILCIMVLTSYVRKQSKQQVEIANFDFQKNKLSLQNESKGSSGENTPLAIDFNKTQMV